MLNRDPAREAPRPSSRRRPWSAAAAAPGEGLTAFRRAYRWLNLTLIHQGIWPLVVVVFGAPAVPVELTDAPWYWARLGGPLLAALLALAYLAQRPEGRRRDASAAAESGARRGPRQQAIVLILGVTAAVALLRLLTGPPLPVAKLLVFGAADVAAYQTINFGVVGRAAGPDAGPAWPVALFGLSWGLHDLFLAAASPLGPNLALVFGGGAVAGVAVGSVSWLVRRWPGGDLTAAAMHFLLVYLVLAFLA
jgi:hypothetical protein